MTNFTKNIRKNKIAPKDGSEPLTVIEFSLTNDTRDKLKVLLKPYVMGIKKDTRGLAEIFQNKDNFPQEVLEELSVLSREGGSPSTVYVVKNLPEISREDIPERLLMPENKRALELWLINNSYMRYIGKGVGLAIKLQPEDIGDVAFRYFGDVGIKGSNPHKHGDHISGLGGVISDGAPTRFIDMGTMLEQVHGNKDFGKLPVTVKKDSATFPLEQFETRYPNWRTHNPIGLSASNGDQGTFENLVAQHSLEVTAHSGDLILWANDGRIFHQALHSKNSSGEYGDLARFIFIHDLYRTR